MVRKGTASGPKSSGGDEQQRREGAKPPRRGETQIAPGETRRTNAEKPAAPEGVELDRRRMVRPFQGRLSLGTRVPWVTPTAIHVESLRDSEEGIAFAMRHVNTPASGLIRSVFLSLLAFSAKVIMQPIITTRVMATERYAFSSSPRGSFVAVRPGMIG